MSIIDTLADIVRNAGYIATTDGRCVSFKVEGTKYRFETFQDDDSYARLSVGFSIPDDVSVERLLVVANEWNVKVKTVKTVVQALPEDGYVSFRTETFFGDATAWEPIFERSLSALRGASDGYYESLNADGG